MEVLQRDYKLTSRESMIVYKKKIFFLFILSNCILSFLDAQNTDTASIKIKNDSVFFSFQEKKILAASFGKGNHSYSINQKKEIINDCIYQTVVLTSANGAIELSGEIFGDNESIACESEAKDGLKYVRHVVGLSNNMRNQSVYERKQDWLISFDNYYNKVLISPSAISDSDYRYNFSAKGAEIIIRFKPQFYKKHRGLEYFEPSTYSVWKKPVVGWCSWFAFLDNIDEEKIKHTADVISKKLKPFGLEYLQIDDGYQQNPIGLPNTWLTANKKFPSGLQNLASYISNLGLKPAIWTNVSFADSVAAFQNKNLFVQNNNHQPARGNWIGYVMDGSNQSTLEKLVAPVYNSLQKQGWKYFKLDALRHLKYEGYNSYAEYFSNKNISRNEAYQNFVKAVRKEIGKENFLLACWGIRPELVGIADGCRIGNDGYSYAGLAQFNSYNNIIWRNDPDHIELSEKEAYRSCTATSLTGSLFMLTDKPEKYETSLTEAARRCIPVLFTQPGQVYDVDPSRSSHIAMADVEMSGSGPRIFDASSTTTTGLFLLEINRPFENWLVLGRLDERDQKISFKDLGLDDRKKYICFEFWSKKSLGAFQGQFYPGSIDSNYHCQVFCIREKQDHPQLLATNRHVSCGALEIKTMQWKNNMLEGTSGLTNGDDYTIYINEPDEFHLKKINLSDGEIITNKKEGSIRSITIRSSSSELSWKIEYQ
jgi:alpha-galactosidase